MLWNDKQSQGTLVYIKLVTTTVTEFLLKHFYANFLTMFSFCTRALSSESVVTSMHTKSECCVKGNMLPSENKAMASDNVSLRRLTSGTRFIASEMTG